jgi:hypothetical protein
MARATPLDGALWLVRHGFAVFPADHPGLVQCAGIGRGHDSATCTDRGKHPSVPFTKAHTLDEDQVRRDFDSGQYRNVGIFVGGCTGPNGEQLLVVDSDRPRAIEDTAASLGQQHTPTMRVHTAKGYHDYYWAPAGVQLGNRLGALQGKFDGDVRGGNAFVIGPGSVHATGVTYELEDAEQPPVALPEWLLTALQARSAPAPVAPSTGIVIQRDRHDAYTRKVLQAEADAITAAPDGDQNNAINRAAFNVGTLVGAGALSEGEARQTLLAAARAGNHPEGRAHAAIDSGLTAGIAQPRNPWPPIARDSGNDFSALITSAHPGPFPMVNDHNITELAAPVDEPQSEPETQGPQGLLPEEFWAARPELQHIRQAGHSRNRSGDVAFYATLARLSGMVPHVVRADTGIADLVSLNLFAALVGPSGSGKSTGAAVARRLLTPPVLMDFRDGLPIGSGEGLAEVYMGSTEEPTGEIYKGGPKKGDPVMTTIRAQVRHNAFFYIDEGATLTRLMKERSGSTLGEVLRSAAVGQALGQTNASKDNSRYIPGGSYSMGLLVGFQPETAAPLFEDTAEGTPQRFLWGTVTDPSIPDEPCDWPGELVAWQQPLNVRTETLITFDREITSELRRIDLANARGENTEQTVSALDSHAPVMKIKVGSLLAILAGRLHVTVDDWQLAELVWAASCITRDNVVAYSVRQRREEQEKRTQARIGEELQLEQAKELAGEARADKAVDRIATRVALLVHDEGGETTRKTVRNKFAGRDKKHMVDAINLAILRGWITDSEGGLAPGRSRPS